MILEYIEKNKGYLRIDSVGIITLVVNIMKIKA